MEASCACGGLLYATTVGDTEDAVRRHNQTEQHRRWSEGRHGPRSLDPYEGRLRLQERAAPDPEER